MSFVSGGDKGVREASSIRGGFSLLYIAAAVLASILPGRPAHAQLLDNYIQPDIYGLGTEPSVTVLSRARPSYDSLGTRIGNVTVRPELFESFGYDDNVTGTTKPHGSAIIETNARVQAVFDRSDLNAAATLTVDDVRYPSQNLQSYTNWTAGVGGSYQVGRDLLIASFDHVTANQTLRDLDVPQLDQALAYQVNSARLGYRFVFNRLFVQPNLTIADYTYDSGFVGGRTYLQNYRDRTVYTPGVTVGYQLYPLANAVLVIRNGIGKYSVTNSSPFRRDFNDLAVLGGIDINPAGLVRYRVLGGYEVRTFVSAAYKTIAAPIVEASVIWNPTGLTTLTGVAARSIQDSASEATAGLTESRLTLRVDHELFRNVLLRGSAGYALDEYAHSTSSQTLYTAGAGVTYLVNRNIQVSANYDFASRRSSGNVTLGTLNLGTNFPGQQIGSSYSDNRYLLQVRLAL